MKISFLGAAGTVTGSKYLVESDGVRILVDCGLFQGRKDLRKRNWRKPPFPPGDLDGVVLTHGHIDHSGYVPLLVKRGYTGQVHCTRATRDLCRILLPDSGYLHEEDAKYANRKGFSKHHPALPLYTQEDAEKSLDSLRAHDFESPFRIGDVEVRFSRAGHILGAACVHLEIGGRHLVFSGDLGRQHGPVMHPPEPVPRADILVVESTYGDRLHPEQDAEDILGEVVERTLARRGVLLIPAFAVGRTQILLHLLARLKAAGRLPDVPVYLNSPMAIRATDIFFAHQEDHALSRADCEAMDELVTMVHTVEESKALNRERGPMIIISASGMLSGGRILHHLKTFGGDPANTLLFAGYQAPGTRGEAIIHGADSVKIHGEYWPIRCEVASIDSLSAHADYEELLSWLGGFREAPGCCFITHGEPPASAALSARIQERLHWAAPHIPEDGESVEIPQ